MPMVFDSADGLRTSVLSQARAVPVDIIKNPAINPDGSDTNL